MDEQSVFDQLRALKTEGLVVAAIVRASKPMTEAEQTALDLTMLVLMERLTQRKFNELCAEIEDMGHYIPAR